MPARQLGEVEARDRRGVGERLAVVADELRQDLDRVRLDRRTRGGRCRSARRSTRACGSSSNSASSKPIENVFTGSRRLLRHRGDDGARVDAAGEERAERDVARSAAAASPRASSSRSSLVEPRSSDAVELAASSRAASSARRARRPSCQTSVCAGGSLRIAAERAQRVPGRTGRRGSASIASRSTSRAIVGSSSSARHLRGEPERAAALGVEERLLADAVAREQQLRGGARPRARTRTCPRRCRTQSRAVLLVEVDDHLGVAVRSRSGGRGRSSSSRSSR